MKKKIDESRKVTLTVGQLKRLVKESIMADPVFTEQISAFGVKTLVFSLVVHFWHINCTSDADHNCLREFYYFLEDKGDALIEAIVGRVNVPAVGQAIIDYGEFGDLSIEDIKRYRNEAEAVAAIAKGDAGIYHILGDIIERCDNVIFRLSRLG